MARIVQFRKGITTEDDTIVVYHTTQQPEAGSACSEFGHEDPPPKALTVSRWTRIKRAVRAWWGEPTVKP